MNYFLQKNDQGKQKKLHNSILKKILIIRFSVIDVNYRHFFHFDYSSRFK